MKSVSLGWVGVMWVLPIAACAQETVRLSKWGEIVIRQHVAGTPWFGLDVVTARRSEEGWGVARHVKMTHRVEGPRRMNLGMMWMEGTAGGAVQRAVLPWADRMTWMQTPSEGARASIWVSWEDAQGTRTWSVHAAWAPSQQVAFRCALRLSWEA
ncbi:MAG: hypothetical protein CL822_02780 [Crocinitomicaceae bacterium]|nr:hypothetical protein [Crocinitomicaceae bacterium]